MKTGPDAPGTVKMRTGAQNIKIETGTLGTVEKESGSAKHENRI
jgi:hypothetical protein